MKLEPLEAHLSVAIFTGECTVLAVLSNWVEVPEEIARTAGTTPQELTRWCEERAGAVVLAWRPWGEVRG